MENVKVILWGLGAMGGGIGKMITKKKGVDIVGAIDIGDKLGKSLYDVVPGMERGDREDVIVGTAEEVIKPKAADIVVVCTGHGKQNERNHFRGRNGIPAGPGAGACEKAG